MKITIIGAGNMGGAIARGLAKGSVFREQDITVTARSQETLDSLKLLNPGFCLTKDNAEAVKNADLVVLAIKPWLIKSVIDQIRPNLNQQMLLSVVAGVTFEDLQNMIDPMCVCQPVIFRVIPNTAIAIGQSMTLIAANRANDQQRALVKSIFDELGESIYLDESLMGAGTALCSCGIAFAFKYMKASIDGGVELGFYPEQAKQMIAQTMKGAIELLNANGTMPDEEIYKVTTPGGITIRGLNEMDARGFSTAVIGGLRISVKR